MSLASICANAADNVGVSRPSSIIGSTDAGAVRLLQLARRSAQSIAKKANWSALVLEHVFIADGSSNYTLPSDYRSLVNGTIWDRSSYWQMRGGLSSQQWQAYQSSLIGNASIQRRWRIRVPNGGAAGAVPMFLIDPAIATSDLSSAFVFEYVSNHWCRSATQYSLERVVVYGYINGVGEFIIGVDPIGGTWTGATGLGYVVGDVITVVGGTSTVAATILVTSVNGDGRILAGQVVNPGVYTVRPTSPTTATGGTGTGAQFITDTTTLTGLTMADWAADTDTAIIDEDLIELGVIWRLQARLGIAYAEEKEEYERRIDTAIARDGGASVLSLARGPWYGLDSPYLADVTITV